MAISAFDLFKIGIGPSSSHTVGPMRAAGLFTDSLVADGVLDQVARVRVELFGSLGATGHGHGSVPAIVLGLLGEHPETVDPAAARPSVEAGRERPGGWPWRGSHEIEFDVDEDIVLHRRKRLPFHSNAMVFTAADADGGELSQRTYYSVGGGFVLDQDAGGESVARARRGGGALPVQERRPSCWSWRAASGLPISGVMLANELVRRDEAEVRSGLLRIWAVMQDCVAAGCRADGVLPGGLKVRRRARKLAQTLESSSDAADPLYAMEWVTMYALAVNEENAAGGRVVTAPTNGAAGIIPAVLHYYVRFVPGADEDGVVRFLLTAAAIGVLFKENASISGAEVGCQGEVGLGVLDGRRRPRRGARRHPRAGRERRRDRRRAQPRADLRPGRRPGADPVHRAERDRLGQGDHRRPDGRPRRRLALRLARQGDQDDARDRRRHEGQVQGNLPGRPRPERRGVLTAPAPSHR